MRRMAASTCFFAWLTGCAGYSIRANGTGDGYDVYRPEPYVLILEGRDRDGNTTLNSSLVWLPDYSTRYRIDTWNVFAKADFTFKITDGWKLTEISDGSDNNAAFGQLVELASELVASGALRSTGQPIHLYKIVYDERGMVTGIAEVPSDKQLSDHKPPPIE